MKAMKAMKTMKAMKAMLFVNFISLYGLYILYVSLCCDMPLITDSQRGVYGVGFMEFITLDVVKVMEGSKLNKPWVRA